MVLNLVGTFKENRQLFILTAREVQSGKLVGIAPLIIQPIINFVRFGGHLVKFRLPVTALSFLGSNGASPDHLDFITHPDHETEAKTQLLNYLRNAEQEWDVIRIKGLSSSSYVSQALNDGTPSGRVLVNNSETPVIDLPENWEALYNQYNKRLRKNIRRHSRRFDDEYPGKVIYQIISDPDEIKPLIEKMVIFGRQTRGESIYRHSKELRQLDAFFVEVSTRFFENNWLRLYTLLIDGQIISIENFFVYKNKAYAYQTGYDQNWSDYSPGNYIFVLNIQDLIKQKVEVLDLLRGEHDYKRRWATNFILNTNITISCSLIGRVFLLFFKIGKFLRSLIPSHGD